MTEPTLNLGSAVTDHGPYAGQEVTKVVVNPPAELVRALEEAREKDASGG